MISRKQAILFIYHYFITQSRWLSGNTFASDANGPGSTPGRGTLEDDSSFHPFGVDKLSTSFMLGVKSLCTAMVTNNVQGCQRRHHIHKLHTSFCPWFVTNVKRSRSN